MDSSVIVTEGEVTVFFSPDEESPKTNRFFPIDSSDKSPKTEKFQTSVSVSSLAEKFERSGDFGSVIENNSEIPKSNDVVSQLCSELSDDMKSSLKNEKMVGPLISDSSNKDCVTEQTQCMENGANGELQPFNDTIHIPKAAQEFGKNASCVYCAGLQSSPFTTDIPTAAQEVNNKNISCVYCASLQSAIAATDKDTAVQKAKIMNGSSVQSSTSTAVASVEKVVQSSSQDSLEFITEAEITKAVEERVAYFVEKIAQNSVADATSKNAQKSVPGEANENSSNQIDAKIGKIVGSISLKDLEESFIAALKLANCHEKEVAEKNTETLPVPSIQITEASDREDSSSDDAEEPKSKCEVNATEVKTSGVTEMEVSDTEQSTNEKQTPSTSTASQYEKEDGTEISPEERRHSDLQDRNRIFYISSSDLPARDLASLQNSGEFRQPTVSVERMEYLGTNPILVDNSANVRSSCLCSKYVHGVIFLVSFVTAMAGFILYNLAHEGKVPDFCEHLGLVTAILAGIIGAFSCFCYSVLEAFPGIPARYTRMRESQNTQSTNVTRNVKPVNLDEESWSSEKERAFRIQNGISSTRTSAASIKNGENEFLLIKQNDHRELVDKAEKLKKEVVEILDSFTDTIKELEKVEVGMVNGY